MLLLQNQPSGR
ncbi:hypothetical protein LEMLEM_LOCUS3983 [Lemmus lemmus]